MRSLATNERPTSPKKARGLRHAEAGSPAQAVQECLHLLEALAQVRLRPQPCTSHSTRSAAAPASRCTAKLQARTCPLHMGAPSR